MNKIFMNKTVMQFFCLILSSSMALGVGEKSENKSSLTDRFFSFISHNPRLLKTAGLISVSTLCLYCCYKYSITRKRSGILEEPKKLKIKKQEVTVPLINSQPERASQAPAAVPYNAFEYQDLG